MLEHLVRLTLTTMKGIAMKASTSKARKSAALKKAPSSKRASPWTISHVWKRLTQEQQETLTGLAASMVVASQGASPAGAETAAPGMPELFEIEETNPLLASGNVFDGIAQCYVFAEFIRHHLILQSGDEPDAVNEGLAAAVAVLSDSLRKQRDALAVYHAEFCAWKEAQKGGAS